MKNFYSLKTILISLVLLTSLLNAEILSIQVKKTFLRKKPSFLSKSIVKLYYGAQVEDKKIKNSWHLVKSMKGGTIGWVHNSALSDKNIVLSSSDKLSTSASQSEVLMAGKGFNKQVEAEYKTQKSQLDFKAIDKLEQNKQVSRKQLIIFAKNGKLNI